MKRQPIPQGRNRQTQGIDPRELAMQMQSQGMGMQGDPMAAQGIAQDPRALAMQSQGIDPRALMMQVQGMQGNPMMGQGMPQGMGMQGNPMMGQGMPQGMGMQGNPMMGQGMSQGMGMQGNPMMGQGMPQDPRAGMMSQGMMSDPMGLSSDPMMDQGLSSDPMLNDPNTLDLDPLSDPEGGFPQDDPLSDPEPQPPRMTRERIQRAQADLQKYKAGKANLEKRLVENDKWFRMQHWDTANRPAGDPHRSSWLLNSILNKHADAMDNCPSANVLPREKSDAETARALSKVLPTVLDQNEFEAVYSDAWWQKLQAGTAVYGVFWNVTKMNGLGDVEIRSIDLLNLFWEPGVKDIQHSRNLFHVEEQPNEVLEGQYPKLAGKLGGRGFTLTEYSHDDPMDHSQKSLVVDWYYKSILNGRTVLNYCKFVNGEILYASEDDEKAAKAGYYNHGQYPFVFDPLFPIKDSPAGFGYIDVMRDSQERIDALGSAITQNARMRAKKRFFIRTSGAVNEKEYADWTADFVHTDMDLGENSSHIREISLEPLGGDVIVALTADVVSGVKEKCEECGIHLSLSKPFDPDRFLAVVRELIPDSPGIREEALPVLNEQAGLRNLGGDRAAYLEVLQEYLRENAFTSERLNQAIVKGRYAEAAGMAHKVKSSSGSIGAKALYELAVRLQKALEAESLEDIPRLSLEFTGLMERLLKEIRSMAQAPQLPGDALTGKPLPGAPQGGCL